MWLLWPAAWRSLTAGSPRTSSGPTRDVTADDVRSAVLVCDDLGRRAASVALPDAGGRWLVDLLASAPARRVARDGGVTLQLDAYGTQWWRVMDDPRGFVPGRVAG